MTTMKPEEIIREFNKDYPELRRRMMTYLKSNEKAINQRYKRTGNTKITPAEPRTTVINKNRYRVWIDIYFGNKGEKRYDLHVYQILTDARTGKLRIWIFSPSSEEQKLVEFRPELIKRLFPGEPIKQAIDTFMKDFHDYAVYRMPDSETYSIEASFIGKKLIAFGFEDSKRFTFERVYTNQEVETMGEELGLEGNQDPLKIYNLWKKSKEENSEIKIEENLSEEERKKLEIELAWKEYEGV